MVADLPPKVSRTQFSLRELLIGITVFSVCLALVAWLGLFALLLIYIAGLVAAAYWRWISWKSAVGTISVSLLAVTLLAPPLLLPYLRASARQNASQSNARYIAIALQSFKVVHGSYPPRVTYSPTGEALHSWRALILPHLELEHLHAQLDFSTPWNSPTNSRFHGAIVKTFRRIDGRSSVVGETAYLAVIMPNAQPGDPFAVIELPNTKINYLEPRDITLQELDALAAKAPASGRHQDGTAVFVAWPDGAVELINLREVPAKLRERMEE